MTSPADYVARGWKIFPCHAIRRGQCTCSQGINCRDPGKHPLTQHGLDDASDNPLTIQAWQNRWSWANWAVVTGRTNGFIVLDLDPRKGGYNSFEEYEENRRDGPLPLTLRSATGGGGRHLYYLYPPNVTIKNDNRGKWLPGVDIKSDGGYVILPESNHLSGGQYSWINWWDQPVPLPPDVTSDLAQSGSRSTATSDLGDTADILKGVPEGQRDETLFRVACRLRRQLGDDSRDIVEAWILKSARNCTPPFPDDLALRKVEQAWLQDHDDSFVDFVWEPASSNGLRPHDLTDLGNARRYFDQFGRDVLYVGGRGWLVWTDIGWTPDSHSEVAARTHLLSSLIIDETRELERNGADSKELAKHLAWAKRSESAATMNNTLDVLQNVPEIRRSATDFDSDDHLLVCRNGIVDLRTGLLRPIERSDLVTKNTGVVYDPAFRLPRWEEFLWESCGDQETIDYLQRSAGYSLTGDTAEEALWVVSGFPASGKGTFMDGFLAACGSYATTAQSDIFMWNRGQIPPPYELARLAGVRVVSISEIKEGAAFNENLIKQITGGDRVTAAHKYKDPFEYRPQFALWIGTNHDPQAKDDALWRRIKKINFPNVVPPEKRDLGLKKMFRDPEIGGRAVLAWAVRGAMEWYANGLQQPLTVTAAVWEYRAEQDQMQQFINECIETIIGYLTPLSTAYSTYRIWCSNAGMPPKNRTIFMRMMREKGFALSRDDTGQESYINIKVTDSLPFVADNMYS